MRKKFGIHTSRKGIFPQTLRVDKWVVLEWISRKFGVDMGTEIK